MSMPAVSIVIVSWNVREQLRANLRRLFDLAGEVPFEVFVVDNASSDGTAAMVRGEFPSVNLVENAENRGFAAANNQALRLASGEVVLLLNPDMIVEPGALKAAHEALVDDWDIGVLGLRLKDSQGRVHPSVRRFPGLADQLAVTLKLARFFPRLLDRHLAPDFDYARSQDVDQVRGSFFAFRRGLLGSVGYLDEENFFIWYEEVDYCRRVRAAGLKVRYLARDGATDLHGRSFGQVSHYLNQRRFTHSQVNYFRKWHPGWQTAILAAARPFGLAAAALADVVSRFSHRRLDNPVK